MNKDEFMRVVYTSFGISPETTFEEAGKQFKDMLHNVGQCLAEVERKAEVDYDTTIESIKAYLTARGLALPKDFKAFWDWYVIYYGDYLAEYELDIKQEQINEYSLKLTAKLDNRETPPHKAESINIDEILTDIFPDISPDDLNALNTNLLRNGASKLWSLHYTGKKNKLWIKLGHLREAGIDRKTIALVFDNIYWKKTTYGAPMKLEYGEIYSKIAKTGIKR